MTSHVPPQSGDKSLQSERGCILKRILKKSAAMRMHRILAVAAADIIHAVLNERRVLDREIAKAFEANKKWGKRDRAFIAETVFEVVRWRRALGFLVGSDEVNALCAAQWTRMGYALPEWWEYEGAAAETILAREPELAAQPRAVRESIPDWLDAYCEEELGAAWDAELTALNQRTCVYLRVNTLRSTREKVVEWLDGHNVVASEVPNVPDALSLKPGKTLAKSFRLDGRVEIQDAGSQMIAPLVDPQPGDVIIDTCAGAGGKSLHLASLMKNKGRIIGMDVVPRKLQELMKRAKRAHKKICIGTELITPAALKKLEGAADRILIDAPCSGLGTLKRQPDLKWRITPEEIDRIRKIQAEILNSYTAMLKPGGRLVFATCSILPSENRGNVERLLEQGGFTLEEECPVSPATTGFDGFYAAALTKH